MKPSIPPTKSLYFVLIGPLAGIAFWALVAHARWISPLFLPAPGQVLLQLWTDFATGQILPHVAATLLRVTVGCGLGISLGIFLGLVLGYWPTAYACCEALIDFFRSIPIACLFPLFLVILGIGDKAKIGTAAWASTFIVLLSTVYGVRHANPTRILVAKSLRANELQLFTKILLPEALPHIMVGCRTATSLGLVVVLVTEMFMGTETGLGREIYDASIVYRTPKLYSGILVTGLLGYCLNRAFVALERRVVHWKCE